MKPEKPKKSKPLKQKEKYDVYQKISWIPKDKSFRQMMAKMLGIDNIPDDVVGWCSIFWKEAIPDIEIYIDEMAKWIALELKAKNKLSDNNLLTYLRYALTMSIIHELIHLFGKVKNESAVQWITDRLIEDAWLGWQFIPCPLKNEENVTWIECLQCEDDMKHPSCPFKNIRIDAQPRKLEKYRYHVTELRTPLQAYWQRTGSTYARAWNEYYDMMFGKALGYYEESLYPQHCREIELEWKHPDGFSVVGHVDMYLEDTGRLVELKFYYSTYHIAKENKAQPDHVFQAQAYYTIGKKTKPWLFRNCKRITIVYYSKMKGRSTPRRIEIDVPLIEVDLETPARILYEAERDGVPPLKHPCKQCKEWRNKYCRYFICPHHPKFGKEKPT